MWRLHAGSVYQAESARVSQNLHELLLLVASTQQAAEDVAASLQESASRARQYSSTSTGALPSLAASTLGCIGVAFCLYLWRYKVQSY